MPATKYSSPSSPERFWKGSTTTASMTLPARITRAQNCDVAPATTSVTTMPTPSPSQRFAPILWIPPLASGTMSNDHASTTATGKPTRAARITAVTDQSGRRRRGKIVSETSTTSHAVTA
jgi:hypothetical protein